MSNRISRALEGPARAWCRWMHPDPMWPVGGLYRCPSCLRQYPVQWETQPAPVKAVAPAIKIPVVPRPELLPRPIKVLSTTTAQ